MKTVKILSLIACVAMLSAAAQGADTAIINGKIVFDGKAPKMKKIPTDAKPECAELHKDAPLMAEDALVDANGDLKNVFVYVKSGLEGKTFDTPKEPVVIDQKGCRYEPHVFGIMTKQLLLIRNSDPFAHNIHAQPANNDEYNRPQPESMPDMKTHFLKPEVMIQFKCDVHPWMTAYVGVVDNPFYAVTGADGTYSLKGLPAGEYEIVAVHEKYGTQTAKVKVGDGETKAQDFTFKKAEKAD